MTYKIILASQSQKFLRSLKDKKLLSQFNEAFTSISANPKKGSPLVGPLKGIYSWRVRTYRILYEIIEQKIHVYILEIDHRKKVYKQ